MKASSLAPKRRPAWRVVRLEPSEWADTFEGRAREGVAFGLRTISDAEETDARREAKALADAAAEDAPSRTIWADEYNDALVSGVVASSLCDPNDVTRDPPGLPAPLAILRQALTSGAIRRLYHEIELMLADVSPASRHATDGELAELVDLLTDIEKPSHRARRLAAALLDELTE